MCNVQPSVYLSSFAVWISVLSRFVYELNLIQSWVLLGVAGEMGSCRLSVSCWVI